MLDSLTIPGLNPGWLLLAGAAAMTPVLIHLFGRGRGPRVVFPAARFLPSTHGQRGNRVRDRLLLLLRAGAMGLIALGMARPGIPTSTAGGRDAGVSLVLVIDASASMGRLESGVPVFETARARSLQLLAMLTPGRDRAATVILRAAPGAALPSMTGNIAALAQEIERLAPTTERGDASAAVAMAAAMLEAEPANRDRRMNIFTDGQATQWEPAVELPDGIDARVELVGEASSAENFSVADLAASIDEVGRVRLSAEIWNHASARRDCVARFRLGEQEVAIASAPVAAHGSSRVSAEVAERSSVVESVRVEIGDDALAADNIAQGTLRVPGEKRGAVIGDDSLQADRHLGAALAAVLHAEPRWISTQGVDAAGVDGIDVIAVADASALGDSEVELLRERAIAGVLVILLVRSGDSIAAAEDPLWPAWLDAAAEPTASATEFAGEDDAIRAVLDAWNGLRLAAARPARARGAAQVMVDSHTGPIVARVTLGRGAAVLINTPLTPALTLSPWFPAMIQSLVAEARPREQAGLSQSKHVDPREGDLRRMGGALVRSGRIDATGTADAGLGSLREAGDWLLLAAAGLLIAEAWLRLKGRRA